jgi:ParB/RepB/Spo0J family partition protein
MDVEFHQLDLRFETLRARSQDVERRLLGALAECGQQVPIVVVADGDRFVVIDGYKRIRALRRLGRDLVSVVVWPLTVAEALIVERASHRGAAPSALEHGWLLAELSERHGLTGEELARRFGRSASWVSRHLGLIREIPEAIQEQVREGRLPAQAVMKHLLPVCRVRREAGLSLAAAAVRDHLSSRDLGELCRAWLKASAPIRARLLADPGLFLRSQRALASSAPPRPSPDGPRRDLEVALALLRRATRSLSEQKPQDVEELRGLATDVGAALQRLTHKLAEVDQDHAEAHRAHHDPGALRTGDAPAQDRSDPRPVEKGGASGDPLGHERGPAPRPHDPPGRAPGSDPGALHVVPGQPGPGP